LVAFIVRRLIQTVVVLFIVSLLSFLLLHLIPGDPVVAMLGIDATPAQVAQLRHELSLDKSITLQYFDWIWGVFHGDLGKSIIFREDVIKLIEQRLPITAYLSFLALVISTVIGIWAGVISAVRRGGFLDSMISLFANMGIAVPTFWLGILGIYVLGLKLDLLPIQGFTWPTQDFWKSMGQVIMPVFCLSVPGVAVLARQTRSSMLEVIRQDYIRTAISKGLRERIVIYKHALKNALIPVVTLLGMQVRLLVGGAVLTETVFNIPGMGRLLVRASFDKDFLIVQGCTLFIGIAVCLSNLLVDLSYGWIDPRIRYE
jgi:peptide/nickel transport system permease protein